ncbi:ABC transporter substrate-binding protein [Natrialbaceae archaeon A-CW2]
MDTNLDQMRSRRRVLQLLGASGTVVVAGCAGTDDGDTGESPTPTAENDDNAGTDEPTANEAYSVFMEPTGEVMFESVPETWVTYQTMYTDMGVALGQADGLQALLRTFFLEVLNEEYYAALPDVSVDVNGVVSLLGGGSWDEEVFYELDADVHLMDSQQMSRSVDVDELSENVSPFVGNYLRTTGGDFYRSYYTLYEAFEKIAEVFQERERYERLKMIHDDLMEVVQSRLPPEEDRPRMGLMPIGADTGSGDMVGFLVDDGVGKKHYRDLGVKDAFAGMDPIFVSGNQVINFDYEALLEVDPDAIVVQFGVYNSPSDFEEGFVEPMREHPVGQELSAVQNDRVYRGGSGYQGPIMNLFNTEWTAQQLYPDEFGDEELFDRDEVAAVVTNSF